MSDLDFAISKAVWSSDLDQRRESLDRPKDTAITVIIIIIINISIVDNTIRLCLFYLFPLVS